MFISYSDGGPGESESVAESCDAEMMDGAAKTESDSRYGIDARLGWRRNDCAACGYPGATEHFGSVTRTRVSY